MSSTPPVVVANLRRASLRREIIAILAFKLLALVVLYFLFFDERPRITALAVEQRVLAPSAQTGSAPEAGNLP